MNTSIENYLGEFMIYGKYFAKINKIVNENLVSATLYNAVGSKFSPKYEKVTDYHVIPIKDVQGLVSEEDREVLKA